MKYKSGILLAMVLVFTVVACSPTVITIPNGVKGRIIFTSGKDGDIDIYTSDLDGQNLKRLTDSPEQETQPKWSPDGKKIVFSSGWEGHLYIMNADGTNQIRLNIAPYKSAYFPKWSPDGKKIVFSTDTSIVVLDLQTETLSELSSIGNVPSWSPDGKKLVFLGPWGRLPTQQFSIINADGTNQTGLLLQGHNGLEIPWAPRWAPDGKTIAFENAVSKSNTPDLGPFRDIAIQTGIQQKLEETFSKVTFLTFTMIMQPDGSGVTQVTDQCAGSAWSPDSKWIICELGINGNNNSSELYLVNVSSGDSFRLTDTPYNEHDPDWAP